MNSEVLPELSVVDYCLFDKTGTLTSKDFLVSSLIVNEKMYFFKQAKLVQKYRQKSSFSQSKTANLNLKMNSQEVKGKRDRYNSLRPKTFEMNMLTPEAPVRELVFTPPF